MAVRDLFGSRLSHLHHMQLKPQCLSRPWVVAIQHHGIALDLGHIEHVFAPIRGTPTQLATDFDTCWKVLARHGLQQTLIMQSKRILGGKHQSCLVTGLLPIQSSFDFR